jgi:hypothetical protein
VLGLNYAELYEFNEKKIEGYWQQKFILGDDWRQYQGKTEF